MACCERLKSSLGRESVKLETLLLPPLPTLPDNNDVIKVVLKDYVSSSSSNGGG